MKANQTAADMFAILEHEQRIAHFPAPTNYAACAAFYGTIIDQYDAAMMTADTAAALAAKDQCKLFRDYFYEASPEKNGVCRSDVSVQLAKSYRAPDGIVPKWGQEGTFTMTVGSVPVRIEVESLGGLGMYGENLIPHFSIHIVEKTRLFLSHTGYRSFSVSVTDTEPGITLADAIGRILRIYVQTTMKGKLEAYEPYKGYSPRFRRERMIADGILPADPDAEAATETEPTEDDSPVEDDDLLCDGCDASLTMVDEFTENECGTFCARCLLAHTRSCAGCEIDFIEAHGGVHPSPTRSGGALLPAHEALAALSQPSTKADDELTDEEPTDEDEAEDEPTAPEIIRPVHKAKAAIPAACPTPEHGSQFSLF